MPSGAESGLELPPGVIVCGDGHDRVEAVFRGGGAGKLDDVALFDARQVRVFVGVDRQLERGGRRVGGQRRDAEDDEGSCHQHGK